MIISALAHYYDQLLSDPKSGVAAPGWCSRQVKYLLELSLDGTLVAVVPLGDGNHGASRIVPEQVKRSSGIAPNFICDTSSYLLGVDAKGKPERSMKCFEAAKVWHEEVLAESKGEVATAILNFFNRCDPANVDLESIPGLADEGVWRAETLHSALRMAHLGGRLSTTRSSKQHGKRDLPLLMGNPRWSLSQQGRNHRWRDSIRRLRV